jgi:hypothetical protein
MGQKIKVDISEKTLKRMAEFFLKTSVPRIIAEERESMNGQGNTVDERESCAS